MRNLMNNKVDSKNPETILDVNTEMLYCFYSRSLFSIARNFIISWIEAWNISL